MLIDKRGGGGDVNEYEALLSPEARRSLIEWRERQRMTKGTPGAPDAQNGRKTRKTGGTLKQAGGDKG